MVCRLTLIVLSRHGKTKQQQYCRWKQSLDCIMQCHSSSPCVSRYKDRIVLGPVFTEPKEWLMMAAPIWAFYQLSRVTRLEANEVEGYCELSSNYYQQYARAKLRDDQWPGWPASSNLVLISPRLVNSRNSIKTPQHIAHLLFATCDFDFLASLGKLHD